METLVNLANPNFSKGSLKFTGAPVAEAPPIFKHMQPIAASKATLKRKAIVLKKPSLGSDTNTSANSRTTLQEIDVNVETSLTANQLLLPASSPATEVVIRAAPTASVNLDTPKTTPSSGELNLNAHVQGKDDVALVVVGNSDVNMQENLSGKNSELVHVDMVKVPPAQASTGKLVQSSELIVQERSSGVVDEAVKCPRSPLKKQDDNALLVEVSNVGMKSRANVRFSPSALGLIHGPDDSLIMKTTSLLQSKKKRGRPIGSRNRAP
ncbi:hypothetical protein ACLB2K_011630 [Fragaria x ananassa]